MGPRRARDRDQAGELSVVGAISVCICHYNKAASVHLATEDSIRPGATVTPEGAY
jgi:hypothetical protein